MYVAVGHAALCSGADFGRQRLNIVTNAAVSFNTGQWRLFFGIPGEAGRPLRHFTKLYASNTTTAAQIEIARPHDLSQLGGFLIGSETNALELVRLFTDRENYVMFAWPQAIESSKSPIIVKERGGFTIQRELIQIGRNAGDDHLLLSVREFVGTNGTYELLTQQKKGKVPRNAVRVPRRL